VSAVVVGAYTADQVARLSGLTMRQLGYWDSIGFFRPQYASENRRSPYSRIYSFSDLIGLRTISVLKGRHGVPLKHLKETAAKLTKTTDRPWSELKFTVWNREVAEVEPGTGVPEGVLSGQRALFSVGEIIDDMEKATARLRARSEGDAGKIVRNRNVAHNKPVFSGTRIPIGAVQRFAKAGYSTEQILKEYPSLTEADVQAALQYLPPRNAA
jgi:uncharacterized protein (DUF433 family)